MEMRKLLAGVLPAFILLVGIASMEPVRAGTILVSGDSNTTDTLGSAGNEDLFFTNILGGGSSVAVLDFSGAGFGSASNTDNDIDNFYSTLGGVSSSIIAGTVTSAVLAGVDLFVAPTPDDAFTASEVAVLLSFLADGNTVFFLGENNNSVFNVANAAISQVLADLGSGITYTSSLLQGGGGGALLADPCTAGLTDLRYIAGSQVTGGKILYTDAQGLGLITRTEIPEPATLLLVGAGLRGFVRGRRKPN